ncbi:MBL fold metallo-hydrolase [Cellulomonas carbonis]|uniref:Zn-dependent hydrolase n=1 Tax=Cellulomonas carbonis T26 TaxID=947969 RepID=A0A0A0BVI3_9CELL|nr:MBL fold metallo-hydrolase [Cellulomonas carbonis]KGM11936.1 Zn-dependent hydrolase [Cellulomonas carbonis T26]GGB95287.1 Zn-dependent hydrolase [Cellulomonas carbonis]
MAYSGDVVTGGPSDVRVLDGVTIRKASVGPMDNDVYLLTCRTSGEQLLVDAAADPDRLLALVREGSPAGRLDTVVTTHRHPDHTGALESLLAVTGAVHACGADDALAMPVAVQRRLHHGDVVSVGHLVLDVVGLRGHTPGSVALAYREPHRVHEDGAVAGRVHLFTGDSLFPGGPGRTTDPEAFRSLMTDLEERVFGVLDDETWVYPGHGRDTVLGDERPHLQEWWSRGW